jgi:hypothetical protein
MWCWRSSNLIQPKLKFSLNKPESSTLYDVGPKGYTDYPTLSRPKI